MRKYKVNRGEPVKMPSKEAIEKYKDFSRLRHEYDEMVRRPQKPLYKDKKMFLVLLIILLLTYLIILATEEKEGKKKDQDDDNGWIEMVDEKYDSTT
ncbi:hypothetical protein K6119_18410 [Paracrocinitomix mangrovi]|uniref:hypothetical protein n=1 Tax=Paracrocinitomix mangrovi TaxID=2862509 RepID=UPI001C8EDF9B|nr:hypothetical protein [Paracrocinitomix mangrovi]UKN01700.1 hypothetical protein K6119_18410 [Paracrocinitomix mangrovi]